MSFPKYPEYKDSGVEWLGEVPAHWDIFSLKRDLEFLTSGSRGWASHYSDDGAAFIRIGNLTRDHIHLDLTDLQRVNVPDGSEGERTKVKAGDVLFSITAYLGSVAVVQDDIETAYVSQHVALARLFQRRLLPSWVAYVTLSDAGKNYLSSQGYGGTKIQLSLEDVADLLVTAPPLCEQASITSFLDHETARIDALVEEQQRLIELLKEKRQAVISHAVTKGLDPDVPMKDSGVEWLGEVPAHWDTPRLKHVADAQGGSTPSKEREDYWLGDIPWVSPKDMKRDVINKTIDNVSEEAVGDSGLKIIPCRSVLVVVRGMILAHTFPVALSGVGVTINQDMKAIIPACERLLPEYLRLLLRGIDEVIFDCIDSSAHGTKKLQWEEFFNTQVPLPSLDEQLRISSEVQAELDQLEKLTSQAQLMARTLSERRSALISAAVTGKIDVRGWQPPAGSPVPEATQTEMV